MLIEHNAGDLITLFDDLFAGVENTRLVKGDGEPIYIPADKSCPNHRVVFAHGFYSSALHEISHWCIAGEARRQLVDYGYWYAPDGRGLMQQVEFEKVEVKPQALEWILSAACNKRFRISADNLSGDISDTTPFKNAVYQQLLSYCHQGLSARAKKLHTVLSRFYQTPTYIHADNFTRSYLD